MYTTDVIVDEHEFADSKSGNAAADAETEKPDCQDKDGFMEVPEGEELPFD